MSLVGWIFLPLFSLCFHSTCILASLLQFCQPQEGRAKQKKEKGIFLALGNLRGLEVKAKYWGGRGFEKSKTLPT